MIGFLPLLRRAQNFGTVMSDDHHHAIERKSRSPDATTIITHDWQRLYSRSTSSQRHSSFIPSPASLILWISQLPKHVQVDFHGISDLSDLDNVTSSCLALLDKKCRKLWIVYVLLLLPIFSSACYDQLLKLRRDILKDKQLSILIIIK